jgi:hypothetical protein
MNLGCGMNRNCETARRAGSTRIFSGLVANFLVTGFLATGLPVTPAYGGESSVKLAAGAQAALVQLRCSSCHSLDYIVMNSPFLTRAAWEAEVRKMMKVMGAPIPENDVGAIVDYLTQYYGAG